MLKDTTGADGRATMVAVITGDNNGNTFDSHIVRASGAAGAGEAHPALADGTPATLVEFIDGTLQTSQCHLPTLEHILSAHTLR